MIRWIKCKLFHNYKDSKEISSKKIDGVSPQSDLVYREIKRECKCGRTFDASGLTFHDGVTAEMWLDGKG
jgi:hypothetical protein